MKDSIRKFIITIGSIFRTILVFTFPVMLLWNWLMPLIFHLPKINFWQALGLNLLFGFLFRNTSYKG